MSIKTIYEEPMEPEVDDRAPCKCCGAPVDEDEYDDNGGYCDQCVIEAQEQRRLDVGL